MLHQTIEILIIIAIGHSGIAQGTGASFNFEPIDKLTPPHKRSRSEFDAFGVNRDEVIDLETLLKSIQMSVILRQRPPKPYKFLKCVTSFMTTVNLSFVHHLKEVEMKITYACQCLRESQKSEKKI